MVSGCAASTKPCLLPSSQPCTGVLCELMVVHVCSPQGLCRGAGSSSLGSGDRPDLWCWEKYLGLRQFGCVNYGNLKIIYI